MPHYEQKKWEEEQMSSARFRFGAKNKKDSLQDYELIIDDHLEILGGKVEFEQLTKIIGTEEEVKS